MIDATGRVTSTVTGTAADSASDRFPEPSRVTTLNDAVADREKVRGGKANPYVPDLSTTGATTARPPSPVASTPFRRRIATRPSGTSSAFVVAKWPVSESCTPSAEVSSSVAGPISPGCAGVPGLSRTAAGGGGVTRKVAVAAAPGFPSGSVARTPATYRPGVSGVPPVAGSRNAPSLPATTVATSCPPIWNGAPFRVTATAIVDAPSEVTPMIGTSIVPEAAARREASTG